MAKRELTPEELADKMNNRAKIKDEIKSFFVILVVFALVGAGAWYWYNYIRDPEANKSGFSDKGKENDTSKEVGYKLSKLDLEYSSFYTVNDKYIIEFKNDTVYRIHDLSFKELYNSESGVKGYIYENGEGVIYNIESQDADNENVLYVRTLEDGEFKLQFKLAKANYTIFPIIARNSSTEKSKIVGFFARPTSNRSNTTTYVYDLEGHENELIGYDMDGLSMGYQIINSDRYFVIKTKDNKYGLFDYQKMQVAFDATYDYLNVTNSNNDIIVEKDGKYGLINEKQKILVDIDNDIVRTMYDNSGYILVKDDKISVIDDNYNKVIGYEMSFDYLPIDNLSMDFDIIGGKYNNKYIVYTFKHGSIDNYYFVFKDGTYKQYGSNISISGGDLYSLYDKSNKVVIFYNDADEELFRIDFKQYSFDLDAVSFERDGDIIHILANDSYYDVKTGKEVDINDLAIEHDNIKIEYDGKKETVYLDDEKVLEFENKKMIRDLYTIGDYYYTVENDVIYLFTKK